MTGRADETAVSTTTDLDAAVLNAGQEDEFEILGFRRSRLRWVLAHCLSVLLLGFPYLVGYWKPEWRIKWYHRRCPLHRADTLLVLDGDPVVTPITIRPATADTPSEFIHRENGGSDRLANVYATDTSRLWLPTKLTLRHFEHKHVKYFWSSRSGAYVRLRSLETGHPAEKFTTVFANGLSPSQQAVKRLFYGANTIDVEVKSYFRLLFEEVLNPFYIFQIGSIALWSADEYVNYASCILFISVVSIVVSLLETRRQSQNLHNMVASSNALKVNLVRAGSNQDYEEVDSTEIVPGDVIVIPPHGCTMACDAVLIAGTCIVNESMLTGESVPVTKTALTHDADDELYGTETHKRNTLFAGTSVIQTRYYGESHVLAVVVSTGFQTARGDLIRSILYPKPMGFKFYRDSIRFILVLFATAALGMGYCMYVYIARKSDLSMIVLRCLDIITIVVPPALPAAMTVGTYYAQNRLKNKSIFSISPQRINICGKLKLVCFDKTGTLTEDGLDMWGVVPTTLAYQTPKRQFEGAEELPHATDIDSNDFRFSERCVESLPTRSPIMTCLASCHSLTLIDEGLIGDPLDVKMFESTGWELEEAGKTDTSKFDMLMPSVVRPRSDADKGDFFDPSAKTSNVEYPYEVGIIRQFTFSSAAARMSVITRALGDNQFRVFTKGAPEKMEELCVPESLPKDFHHLLKKFTVQGFRVIALAYRTLPSDMNWLKVQKMKRDQAETELIFLGFLVMQNTLKPETRPVIEELQSSNIRTVMVTGDNLMTAVSVARECNMVGRNDRVIVVDAKPPRAGSRNPSIEFNTSDEMTGEDATNGSVHVPIDRDYHFAVTGKSWAVINTHFKNLLPKLIRKGKSIFIFALLAFLREMEAQFCLKIMLGFYKYCTIWTLIVEC